MKFNLKIYLVLATFAVGLFGGCQKQLDLKPTNENIADKVFNTFEGYQQAIAKVYGAYTLTGNGGPAGIPDVPGLKDEGFSDFVRGIWNLQELTTDEAVVAWGDVGIQDFHNLNWSSGNGFIAIPYTRIFFQITLCNEFIRQGSGGNLDKRGITGDNALLVKKYTQEARFLRAFDYWIAMDLFGNPSFVTENDLVGATPPKQIARKDLFLYLEKELKELETTLPARNEYGRASANAASALLARLYLNAKIYTGEERNTDAITYSKKVIDAGYSLLPNYRNLMIADNNVNPVEFIMTVNFDGVKTQSYGGTNFFNHASVGGDMKAIEFGVDGGWAGLRTTKNIPLLFPDTGIAKPGLSTIPFDNRAQFFRSNLKPNAPWQEISTALARQKLEIANLSTFNDGYAVVKYRNLKADGSIGNDPTRKFVDIDYPLFRLAEQHLIYAEAVLRGGTGGDRATALGYINQLRERAYGSNVGNITDADLTLDFILDERARELYWEGHRRTDLIRYDRFTEGSYLWPFKGGEPTGKSVADYYKLFPIPSAELLANPNLKQNTGY